jgi:DNA-binding NarL/FixJ family response regulator
VTGSRASPSEIADCAPGIGASEHATRVFAKDDPVAVDGPEPPRILIIEDDFLVASELQAGLSEAGFDVIGIAMTADEAIAMAKAERPVLAIVDIRLAGRRDGVEAAIELLQAHSIRSIFATAHADPETRRRAQPAAPLAWVVKPYNASALVPLIRQALASRS